MRQAKVLYKGALSGVVTQGDDGAFRFVYDPLWLADTKAPPISLAMPKQAEPYTSVGLFPVLFNLLPEGENRTLLCRAFRLDQDDDFGLLLCIAKHDTIGAITVAEIKEKWPPTVKKWKHLWAVPFLAHASNTIIYKATKEG